MEKPDQYPEAENRDHDDDRHQDDHRHDAHHRPPRRRLEGLSCFQPVRGSFHDAVPKEKGCGDADPTSKIGISVPIG
jgi:hypothetical protein